MFVSRIAFGEDMRGENIGAPMQSITGEHFQARCSHETERAGGVACVAAVVGRV